MDWRLWRREDFWVNVAAGVFLLVVAWLAGTLLGPLVARMAATTWSGVAEWLHQLGWFAFVVTAGLWYLNARLLPARRDHRPISSSRLVIHKAQYGLPGHDMDVRDTLTRLIENNRLDIPVTNATMGDDPIVGQHKRLIVTYTGPDGIRQHKEVSEKDWLKLP